MNFESQQDKRIRQLQSDLSMAPLLATLRKEAEALSLGRHSITLENTANLDLLGSPKDLHSALSNLVSNAVRFYRVSSSRSRDSGGTGLGLSIVKHVLGLHQARLDIRSTPGQGSTFTCGFGRERLLAPETHDSHAAG